MDSQIKYQMPDHVSKTIYLNYISWLREVPVSMTIEWSLS